MRLFLASIAVILVFSHSFAKEIALPSFVLQRLVGDPEKFFNESVDESRVQRHNERHTKDNVVELLLTIREGGFVIDTTNPHAHVVRVTAPRELEFLFERRISKWVDGSDYPYYVITGINEPDRGGDKSR